MAVQKWPRGDTSVSVEFNYAGDNYELKVTDPTQKSRYIQRGLGVHPLSSPAYICVSLSELHDAKRTKLAAAVLTKEGPA